MVPCRLSALTSHYPMSITFLSLWLCHCCALSSDNTRPLHWLFPLPGCSSLSHPMAHCLISSSLLKCHLLSESYSDDPIFSCNPTPPPCPLFCSTLSFSQSTYPTNMQFTYLLSFFCGVYPHLLDTTSIRTRIFICLVH